MAHGGVVEKQALLGPSTLLDYVQQRDRTDHTMLQPSVRPRLTILVLDTTLWPSRASAQSF